MLGPAKSIARQLASFSRLAPPCAPGAPPPRPNPPPPRPPPRSPPKPPRLLLKVLASSSWCFLRRWRASAVTSLGQSIVLCPYCPQLKHSIPFSLLKEPLVSCCCC